MRRDGRAVTGETTRVWRLVYMATLDVQCALGWLGGDCVFPMPACRMVGVASAVVLETFHARGQHCVLATS